jgi:hypothetical protein
LNAEDFQLAGANRQIDEQLCVALSIRQSAATKFRARCGMFGSILKPDQLAMRALNLVHDGAHIRQKGIGFFNSK